MKIQKAPKQKEHAPDCTCSLCGNLYKTFAFKSGYVCESCLTYIKTDFTYNEDKKQSR